MSVVLTQKDEPSLISSRLVRATKQYFDASQHLLDAMIMGIAPADLNWLFLQVLSQELPQAFPVLWMETRYLPEWGEEWRHLCFVEDDATCRMNWIWKNEGEQKNICMLRVDLRLPAPITVSFPIVLHHWSHLVDVISQTGTFSIVLGRPVPWRQLIRRVAPADLLAIIQRESKGMVTLVMSQETTAQLRQYYQAYTAHMVERGQYFL
jgi:hypothetical protein